jgi:hypothetical protein
LGLAADAPATITLLHTACSLSLTAYSTLSGTTATIRVRTASSPAGPFGDNALNCTGSTAAFMTCTGGPVSIPADTFVSLSWSTSPAGTAAPSGIYTYATCN